MLWRGCLACAALVKLAVLYNIETRNVSKSVSNKSQNTEQLIMSASERCGESSGLGSAVSLNDIIAGLFSLP